MKQVMHIFKKDVRGHWPEILACLALVAAYAADQPRHWTYRPDIVPFLTFLSKALPILMIVSWAFLIARVVHAESLVGDRQFWITRPYKWPQLLIAKLLFIIVFINLPLFLAQSFLLVKAYFPVFHSIPGLLGVHLMLAAFLVLPVMTISSVTPGMGQAALAVLGICLFILGLAALSTLVPDSDVGSSSEDQVQAIILLVSCIGVVLLQYARRKAGAAWRWLIGASIAIALIVLGTPNEMLMTRAFALPKTGQVAAAKFALDDTMIFAEVPDTPISESRDEVEVEFPFLVSGLTKDTLVQISQIKLDLELPSGERWTSHWVFGSDSLLPERTRTWPTFTMKRKIFERAKSQSVKANMTFALNVYRIVSDRDVVVKRGGFEIPGRARCLNNPMSQWLSCFAALSRPKPVLITAELPAPNCPINEESSEQPLSESLAYYFELGDDSGPDLMLSPVEQYSISLSRLRMLEDVPARVPLCAGTVLTFSTLKFVRSERAEVNLGSTDLREYVPTFPKRLEIRPSKRKQPGPDHQTRLLEFLLRRPA